MPELPEVETIVRDLNKKIIGDKIVDVWTDFSGPNKQKYPPSLKIQQLSITNLKNFKKELVNREIIKILRRAKYILIELKGEKILLIHQKLTGHLLLGKWKVKKISSLKFQVSSLIKGSLEEKINNYIHAIFYLSSGRMLGLSDLRKFSKVIIGDKNIILTLDEIKKLGPEPLKRSFTFKKFIKSLKDQKRPIKEVLMNQEVIAGIGNIYSSEILWEAKIYPFKKVDKLKLKELKAIFQAIKKILKKAIKLRGDSVIDYRDIYGKKGKYQEIQNVYQREGKPCFRCKSIIKRIKIGGRSTFYCPKCQKIN